MSVAATPSRDREEPAEPLASARVFHPTCCVVEVAPTGRRGYLRCWLTDPSPVGSVETEQRHDGPSPGIRPGPSQTGDRLP